MTSKATQPSTPHGPSPLATSGHAPGAWWMRATWTKGGHSDFRRNSEQEARKLFERIKSTGRANGYHVNSATLHAPDFAKVDMWSKPNRP